MLSKHAPYRVIVEHTAPSTELRGARQYPLGSQMVAPTLGRAQTALAGYVKASIKEGYAKVFDNGDFAVLVGPGNNHILTLTIGENHNTV